MFHSSAVQSSTEEANSTSSHQSGKNIKHTVKGAGFIFCVSMNFTSHHSGKNVKHTAKGAGFTFCVSMNFTSHHSGKNVKHTAKGAGFTFCVSMNFTSVYVIWCFMPSQPLRLTSHKQQKDQQKHFLQKRKLGVEGCGSVGGLREGANRLAFIWD